MPRRDDSNRFAVNVTAFNRPSLTIPVAVAAFLAGVLVGVAVAGGWKTVR